MEDTLVKFILLINFLSFSSVVGAQVQEFTLNNGLKLLIKEDHRAPVVVSQVWYKVGSSYEVDGTTGVSHVLEHMMFKGTRKYGEGEFSRIIAENGGRENAFTGDDYTAYFQTLEKSRLPISFELEADRMRNITLPQEAFEKEIEVVKEERRLRTEDNPNSYLREVANATAFQTSPYRQPIIGWMADLEAMKVEDLRSWYKKWYAPNNATVVVVGDVNAGEVYKLANKHFGSLKSENITPPALRPEVPQLGMKRVTVKRPAEIARIILAYKVPGLTASLLENAVIEQWEPYALEVMSGILSGGSSARFESRLVRGREVATGVNSSYQLAGRLDGLFAISGTPAQGRSVEELELAIKAELEELKSVPVSQQELLRVKAQVVSSDVYEKDSAFYQGMILGTFETVGLGWEMADDYVDKISAITAEQVQAVARKYLIDDTSTLAVLEPITMERDGPSQTPASPGANPDE
jgi:zinc protease